MSMAKVAVTIDRDVLEQVDEWVRSGKFPNRSRAVQAGLDRLRQEHERRGSLLEQLARLDPADERALTEEWLPSEAPWPKWSDDLATPNAGYRASRRPPGGTAQ